MEFYLFCQIFYDFVSKFWCQMSKNYLKFKKVLKIRVIFYHYCPK
jgi:hypothetical protein